MFTLATLLIGVPWGAVLTFDLLKCYTYYKMQCNYKHYITVYININYADI